MAEHSRRALTFSQRLAERGTAVIYPGLPSHPQHELILQLANPGYGHGGMFCIDLKTARRVIEIQGNVSALLEDLLAKGVDDSDEQRRPR